MPREWKSALWLRLSGRVEECQSGRVACQLIMIRSLRHRPFSFPSFSSFPLLPPQHFQFILSPLQKKKKTNQIRCRCHAMRFQSFILFFLIFYLLTRYYITKMPCAFNPSFSCCSFSFNPPSLPPSLLPSFALFLSSSIPLHLLCPWPPPPPIPTSTVCLRMPSLTKFTLFLLYIYICRLYIIDMAALFPSQTYQKLPEFISWQTHHHPMPIEDLVLSSGSASSSEEGILIMPTPLQGGPLVLLVKRTCFGANLTNLE